MADQFDSRAFEYGKMIAEARAAEPSLRRLSDAELLKIGSEVAEGLPASAGALFGSNNLLERNSARVELYEQIAAKARETNPSKSFGDILEAGQRKVGLL